MILIILGILLCLFAFPKIRRPIMARLANEGLVTPQSIAPDKTEIIKYTGPSTTLLFIGIVLIIVGIIIKLSF
ncbi:MAG: hypothetical protein HY398_02425 [Candidatus Doudnabacteria bacterium]|nr:hypothetical protein [Candidatus Doudnabacteria bacterium]